jgi:DNA mismatch repair protein MutH
VSIPCFFVHFVAFLLISQMGEAFEAFAGNVQMRPKAANAHNGLAEGIERSGQQVTS